MIDRGKEQIPASPPAGGEIGGWLAAARGPALVIAPAEARLIAANAKGALLLGLGAAFDDGHVPLDSAMPAVMDLRRAVARGQTGHGATSPLVFWTPAGIARLPCTVEIRRGSESGVLALVEIVVATDVAPSPVDAQTRSEQPAIRQDCPELSAATRGHAVGGDPASGAHERRADEHSDRAGTPGEDTRSESVGGVAHQPVRTPSRGPLPDRESGERRAQPASPPRPTNTEAVTLPHKHAPARAHSPPAPTPAPRQRGRADGKAGSAASPVAATAAPPPPPPPAHPQRSDDDTLKAIARQILAGRRAASAETKPTSGSTSASERQTRPNGTTVAAAAHSSARDVRRSEVPTGPTDSETTADGDPPLDAKKRVRTEQPQTPPTAGAQSAPHDSSTSRDDADAAPDEARRGGAMRRTLIRRMAHELKTPVSAIVSAAEIMKDERLGPIGDERYLRYAHDIHESARHALAVIERMLGGRQLESGDTELSFTDLDLNALASTLLSGLETMARDAGLALDSALARRLPRVVADATSVRQIVLNLITNALKFTPRGGRVVLATAIDEERRLTLTVSDSGPGMSESEIARALGTGEPDETAETSAMPRKGGGLGIGLPLARKLAGANGATLQITCPLGGGTQVTLAFPTSRQVPV